MPPFSVGQAGVNHGDDLDITRLNIQQIPTRLSVTVLLTQSLVYPDEIRTPSTAKMR